MQPQCRCLSAACSLSPAPRRLHCSCSWTDLPSARRAALYIAVQICCLPRWLSSVRRCQYLCAPICGILCGAVDNCSFMQWCLHDGGPQPSTPASSTHCWSQPGGSAHAQEDGEEHPRATLDGAPAGSSLSGLSIQCADEAGRPAAACKVRLTTSWTGGCRKVSLKQGVPLPLPALSVRPPRHWHARPGEQVKQWCAPCLRSPRRADVIKYSRCAAAQCHQWSLLRTSWNSQSSARVSGGDALLNKATQDSQRLRP